VVVVAAVVTRELAVVRLLVVVLAVRTVSILLAYQALQILVVVAVQVVM
jgi:hypothetical protein